MNLTPIPLNSSNLNAVAQVGDQLFIRFNSGPVYRYDGAPPDYAHILQSVESAGKFFHAFIRNKLRYTKLDHDPFAAAQ